MHYEEKSDFEINIEVAKANGLTVRSESMRDDGRILVVIKGIGLNETYHRIPDYCNSPADMWPIIVDNGISLLQQDNEEGWCAFRWDNDNAEFWHKNPLRAAAIVFLMMKDAEKAQ